MIQLLRIIKNEFEKQNVKDCIISEVSEEINYLTPTVIISPISEEWSVNALGNSDNKNIRFKILYFDEHIEGNYDLEIEEIVAKIKEVLNSKDVIKEIINFNKVVIDVSLAEEGTKILITANINLKLHRR